MEGSRAGSAHLTDEYLECAADAPRDQLDGDVISLFGWGVGKRGRAGRCHLAGGCRYLLLVGDVARNIDDEETTSRNIFQISLVIAWYIHKN